MVQQDLGGGKQQCLFGIPFAALTLEEVLDICEHAANEREVLTIGVVNAAKLVKMRTDAELRASVLGCSMVLADGMSVVFASRFLRRPLPERVAGIDIFERLLGRAAATGHSVYLLGATQAVLQRVVDKLRVEYPQLRIAGSRDGYFSAEEESAVAEAIRASHADFLFVAMSSPKKENFLGRWWGQLDVSVCHGVGGSFDVLAGDVKRAPQLMQKLGLEWFFRFAQEPGRLWRRYLTTNLSFAALLVRELFRPTPRYPEAGPPAGGQQSPREAP